MGQIDNLLHIDREYLYIKMTLDPPCRRRFQGTHRDPRNILTGIIKPGGLNGIQMNPVQSGRGGRRRWSGEQNLAVLQEWTTGVPVEEACRAYAMPAAQLYRWRRSLDQGLKGPGELIPKRQVLGAQKPVEDRERVQGRKALEVDV